jgi:hypothetical protein
MKRTLILFAIAAFVLAACGIGRAAATPAPVEHSRSSEPSFGFGGGAPAVEAPMNAPTTSGYDAANAVDTSVSPTTQERLVIQNAELVLVVKDPQAKMNEIGAMANRLGGFVVSSNIYETATVNNVKVPDSSITIRVPATELDKALEEIKTGVVEIQSESRSGQDVTDQYVDLQSRLKARQAAETQLLEMLAKSQSAEDTLAIFNTLTQIQSEIEVLKGQIQYYEQAAALSAISIHLIAEETIQPLQIAGWQPQGEARDAVQALINFFQNFVNFLIWLVIFIIPVGAVIITLLALLWRLLRWFWRRVFPRKTPPPAAPAA